MPGWPQNVWAHTKPRQLIVNAGESGAETASRSVNREVGVRNPMVTTLLERAESRGRESLGGGGGGRVDGGVEMRVHRVNECRDVRATS